MSQNLTFTQTVNQLFFGVDVFKDSGQLLDSFLAVSKLHHSDTVSRQSNLNITMQMKSDKQAWASRHIFSFTESPLPDLKINKGIIEMTIGEAGDLKKLLDLNWKLLFDNKQDATKYFEKLKQIFSEVSTDKKFENDKDVGQIAQFSNRKQNDKGVRNVIVFLSQSIQSKKYELSLLFGNELTGD
jgi:hypothetical protein